MPAERNFIGGMIVHMESVGGVEVIPLGEFAARRCVQSMDVF
jgi:hypothetical protein